MNAADSDARSDYLANRPEPDDDYDSALCVACGRPLGNTRSGRCRSCGE